MQQGAFQSLSHEHSFNEQNGGTLMTDVLDFRSPLGPLGWIADFLILKPYMNRFLKKRGDLLKQYLESC